jgi:hypothetical protein
MADVVLSNDDITVLSPPEIIEVLVDIGPRGQRGSTFLTGTANPNSITLDGFIGSNQINLLDMYIRTSPGANYGFLYQYVSQPGGNTWVEVLQIIPALYSKLHEVLFTAGSGSVTIDISDIYTVTGNLPTSSNFNIQHSFANANPVSSSISDIEIVNSGTQVRINFKAVESDGGTWQNLSGEVTVHLFISILA